MFPENLAMSANVLYVDDDPLNSSLMKRVLESEGYRVSVALDGLTGLSKANLERPDLILLDVNMPDMNGYEVARHLRQMERTKHIPILFVSATTPSHEYLRVGANGFIAKPIDVDLIPKQIASYLAPQMYGIKEKC